MMKRNLQLSPSSINENMNKKVALVERNAAPNGIPLVSLIAVAKKAPNDLVELAAEIQKSHEFINATACSKLQVIAEQVRFLQNQAQKVLLEAKLHSDLHNVACNFKKVPGNTYYLYQRQSGQNYLSMLSPQEWPNSPHEFLGGYRLEGDHSWTPEDQIIKKDAQNMLLNKIFSGKESISTHTLTESAMEM